ncbi:hypothetical protein LTR53_012833 [Teratosphaeriaceae sp. CCFEE 6253]|nr:hypothetical protein LTR53_012833 [Teratosphaeriaceae sp. CCFEE 6253]
MAPSRSEIESLAAHLASADQSPFFARVSPDVVWDVMGAILATPRPRETTIADLCSFSRAGTHPAAGHFTSLETWKHGALGVINQRLTEPLKLKIVNVSGGGADQEWATVELEANGVCKNGMEYPQRYAWIMRFDDRGTIVQVRAYLDSALVQKAVDQNP